MKKLITSMLIVLLLCVAFIGSFYKGYYSYATNQDGTLTNDELDIAMSSWLQSHGGNIFSLQNYRARKTYEAGLLHNFIYGDGGGYDAIRQHIYGGVGGNNELRFDYDGFIIQKLNTWLNRELQNGSFGENASLNDNGMFDTGVDDTLYSGELFTDLDGNSCLVYYMPKHQQFSSSSNLQTPIKFGTTYRYDGNSIKKLYDGGVSSVTFNVTPGLKNYSRNISYGTSANYPQQYAIGSLSSIDYQLYCTRSTGGFATYGNLCIYRYINSDNVYSKLAFGYINKQYVNNCYNWTFYELGLSPDNQSIQNVDINFYTNNILQTNFNITDYPDIDADGHLYITPKVKVNGKYENYTINQGDTITNVINNYYNDSNEKDKTVTVPSTTPDSGSGGGGGSSGSTPPSWNNPYPNLSPDGNGGFNFNFTLPDLNIDWNISGLSEKFPFSIPFDFIRFVSILNAEPETPHFEGTVNLIVYEWNIDADLSDFDNLAGIVRNVEFIGFCITLILITRKMIKG